LAKEDNNPQLLLKAVNIMKKNPLFFLFLLLIFPTISIGAEMRTLDVEFSFTNPDDPAKQLLGYRLYKEGEQVCEANDPNTSRVSCEIYTEDGTFDFTLTAYYADSTESPHSPSFPFTIVSATPPNPEPPNTEPPNTEPPTAVLSSSTAAGNAPLNVTFNGTSSTTPNSSIVSYSWTFGDGSQATGETISHTFTTAGTYYTQLTVVDSQGLSDTASTPIVVIGSAPANEKPIAVIADGTPSVDEPLTFSFDGSQSSDPDGSITQYSWNFGDGTTGSGQSVLHTYSSAATYTVSLQVTDDRGETATTSTEIVCNTPLPNNINIEVGEVSIDHNWVTIAFEKSFSQPVIIAGPPTMSDAEPVLVRIRNINETGFQIRLQEWDYQDGTHAPETFSYMVIEKGIYTLDNGSKIEAGNFTGSSSFGQVSLQQLYDFTPVILTQVITENETDAVTGRVRNPNQYSFEFKLQEMEETANAHVPETIGYIAWEPGKGEISGLLYEIGTTAKSVTHNWFNLNFETEFPDLPFFIAGMQTDAWSWTGSETATIRSQNMSPAATQIKIEEEQSKDSEVWHTREVVGYFTIGAASATTVQP
jgi:PKD repeat protein